MAATDRRNRDKAMASYLAAKGIVRRTGRCPWGCGRDIANGGDALLSHLVRCQGRPRKVVNKVRGLR